MPFEKSYDEAPLATLPACVHLRSKSIYVHGDRDQPEKLGQTGSGHCWCNVTQHVIGPDEEYVNRTSCVPGRDCYRASY